MVESKGKRKYIYKNSKKEIEIDDDFEKQEYLYKYQIK